MLSSKALSPLAPVFFTIASLDMIPNAFSVKCNFTWKFATDQASITFQKKVLSSVCFEEAYIVHTKEFLVLFPKSIFGFYKNLQSKQQKSILLAP